MGKLFDVSYEIVTPESAEDGDAAERGMIGEDLDLRTALDLLLTTRTSLVGGVEAVECDSWPTSTDLPPRRVTVYNGMEFETGAYESRSLHLGDVTPSTAIRIARLAGAI